MKIMLDPGAYMPVHHATFELVDSLDETERCNNGFGSTGRS